MKPRLSIKLKVTLVFVLFAAALLTGAGIFAYNSGRNALQAATTADLLSTANEKQAALNDWIEERLLDVAVPAGLPHLLDDIADLTAAAPNSSAERAAHDHLVRDLKPRTGPGEEFLMLFVMDPDTGKVLAATDPREEGTFKESRAYFVNGKNAPFVENPYNSLELRRPAMTVSAPLRSADGRLLGVLAGHVNLDRINAIISRRTGTYKSDDAFLVNTSNLLVTQPRSMTDPAVLRRGIHTEPVRRGLTGQSGTMLADDYRGVPVIAVYRWMPERRLCLIVKIDQAEAFAPSRAFGQMLAIFGVLVLLMASALATWLAHIGTRPILTMQAVAARFGRGELDVRLSETARDELGDLAREFNQMAAAISEREDALGKWAHIFENAEWGVVASNVDGETFGLMNRAFASMHGYTVEELVGTRIVDTYAPDERAALPEYIRRASETGHHTFESKQIRKDGTVFPVLVDLTAVKDAQGQVLYRTANVLDITERKRMEEELQKLNIELERKVVDRTAELSERIKEVEQLNRGMSNLLQDLQALNRRATEAAHQLESKNRELETFTYSVSHDLKAPLRGIDGYSRLLLEDYINQLDEEGRYFLQTIRSSVQQMNQLIEDLLAYSRLEHRAFATRRVNPRTFVEMLIAERGQEIKDRNIKVRINIPCENVTAEAEGLTQVLRNLIDNAIKFTRDIPEPNIEISCDEKEKSCILKVWDNGPGFDMKYCDRIFDIFQRLHRAEDYPGTGIGLAIVRKAMERMGGRVWAESKPGEGATFYLEVPK